MVKASRLYEIWHLKLKFSDFSNNIHWWRIFVTSYTHDVTSQVINVAYINSGIHL